MLVLGAALHGNNHSSYTTSVIQLVVPVGTQPKAALQLSHLPFLPRFLHSVEMVWGKAGVTSYLQGRRVGCGWR